MGYKFRTKPMQHQYEALKFIGKSGGVGALLMDPGTGKSKVTIDYIGAAYDKWGGLKVLIAAPLSALDTWVDEFEKHLGTTDNGEIPAQIHVLNDGSILDKAAYIAELEPFDGLQIVVINHDAFKYRHKVPGLKTVTVRDRIITAVTDKWCPDIVVVDELHRLKTHSSNVSSAFKKIGKATFQRIGLTGTVAPHSPLDFFGQWQFVKPQTFGDKWMDFRYYYAIYGGWEGKQVIGFYTDRLKEMKRKIRQDAYIVKKREALDLPPVSDIVVPVSLTTELPYYLEMGKELMIELPSGKQSISRNTLTKMLRLRQITGGVVGYKELAVDSEGQPILDSHGIQREISKTEDIGNSKLKVLLDKVETIYSAGEKQVIFAHFRRDVARIVEALNNSKDIKAPVYSITGDTDSSARKRHRKAFYASEEPAIFVAQMRTVSLAVNEFVCASYAHFYSLSQLRDDYIQARDRLDRKGQENPVTFYHYVVPHSIDQVILESHKEKGRLEAAVTKRAKEILTLGK